MRRLLTVALFLTASSAALAAPPEGSGEKAKFYDFSDQLIDGEIKKPTALYTDARQKAKFERLLKLKRDFLPQLRSTSKDATLR